MDFFDSIEPESSGDEDVFDCPLCGETTEFSELEKRIHDANSTKAGYTRKFAANWNNVFSNQNN